MSSQTHSLSPALYKYLLEVSLREPDILKELREKTRELPLGVMQISPEQGQFMRLLIHLINAVHVLEIGVFTGYSTLSMALALPDHGKITACDINPEWTSMGQKFWDRAGIGHKVDLILRPAQETLSELVSGKNAGHFDLAFIDADKVSYDIYYEYCLQLVKPGGLILIDNTLWEGKVIDPQIEDPDTNAIQKLNTKIHGDHRVELSLLPIGDGLTLVRKNGT